MSSSKKSRPSQEVVSVYQLPREEMISNGVHYCLVMQNTKLPIRRIDLLKIAFANQTGDYALVIKELEDVLEEVFGIRLIGVNDSSNEKKQSSSYILVSRFFKMTNIYADKDEDTTTRNALLYMILTAIFMTGRSIDEDAIWRIMSELQLYPNSCGKREEVHRFLKNAYILPLYLTMEKMSDGVAADDGVRYRYAWGFRAEMEMSKYWILKYAAKQFPDRKPADFANQFTIINNNRREKKIATKDAEDELQGMDSSQFTDGAGTVNDSIVEEGNDSSEELELIL